MTVRHSLAAIAFALVLPLSAPAVRADSVSFSDEGTYGVTWPGGAGWEGFAVASASFLITFDPTQYYPVQSIAGIISNLEYSVTDPRFQTTPLTLNPITSFQYAYGTLTLYSDATKNKDLKGTPNITIGINGWTNLNPASAVWYSQTGFFDTLTTSGEVSITASPVPLPAALPLFAGGLGLMGWMARRRREQPVH
jgi:hypothetical protein